MPDQQLGLFASRRISDCPRFDREGLCAAARERVEGCPGREECERRGE